MRVLTGLLALITTLAAVTACGDDTPPPLLISSSDQPEMRAAAALYAVALTRAGIPATTDGAPVDPDTELLEALATGRADLFPAFTGQLLEQLSATPQALGGEELQAEVARSLPQGVAVGDPTGVSDRPQLLMSAELRERYGVDNLVQCSAVPAGLPLVVTGAGAAAPSPADLAAFADCRPGPVEHVRDKRALLERVATGQALGVLPALQVASLGDLGQVRTIPADGAPRAQDLVPVYRSAALNRSALKQLSRIAGELSTADLAELGARVAAGEDPRDVAADWLSGRH
ncbi:putative ABC transporter substrate-binding protein [Gordonia hirsuta DSM 44140 = NBRC 16056]|uniref:Putative ABC transporter substrate-binding protein n=2 Tax=Gordonia hirsuta TaxID=53427 RepID=L7L758_9ACTN|nr:putative ABC transporter substrate-binding protein [Gordonia hirsuta DSM 44140 = NBRC 16056]